MSELRNIWNIDLPEIRVNPKNVQDDSPDHQTSWNVRLTLGRVTTFEDFEKVRQRILSSPLP